MEELARMIEEGRELPPLPDSEVGSGWLAARG